VTFLRTCDTHTDAFGDERRSASLTVEIDRVDRDGWYAVLDGFDDANVFQTWDFGRIAHPNRTLSHMILRRDGRPVAAAQVLVQQVRGIGGLALAMWGPMWQPRGQRPDPAVFQEAMRALKQEYGGRRGLFLRVLPRVSEAEGAELVAAMEAMGMRRGRHKAPYRTFVMDLTRDEETIRKSMSRHWRRSLIKAEEAGIEVTEGSSPELLAAIDALFVETQQRKGFRGYDSRILTRVHGALPERMKMRAFLATHEGRPVAGVVVSLLGKTALMQNSATSAASLTLNAAFAAHWRATLWLKAMGAERYDLHGVNAVTNPGVYQFKRGLAGKGVEETVHIGTFEAPGPLLSRLVVEGGQSVRTLAGTCKAQARHVMARVLNRASAGRKDGGTFDAPPEALAKPARGAP